MFLNGESFISYDDMMKIDSYLKDKWERIATCQGKILEINVGTRTYRVQANKEYGRDVQPNGMCVVWEGTEFAEARLQYNSWQWKHGMFIQVDPMKYDSSEVDSSIKTMPNYNVKTLPARNNAKIVKFPGEHKDNN